MKSGGRNLAFRGKLLNFELKYQGPKLELEMWAIGSQTGGKGSQIEAIGSQSSTNAI